MGRYSFIGVRPHAVLRWVDGELREWRGEAALDVTTPSRPRLGPPRSLRAPSPSAIGALPKFAEVEGLPPFPGGAVGLFAYDLVRTVEPLGEPNPDPLGLPDLALIIAEAMLVFDHIDRCVSIIAHAFVGTARTRSRRPTRVPPRPRAEIREQLAPARCRGATRRATASTTRRDPRPRRGGDLPLGFTLEPDPRAVRGQRRPDRRIRARRRRLPGRALAALHGALPGRAVLDLPRPAGRQPLALHVLPRVRRLPDRRRLTRAAGPRQRPSGRDAADRRHLPARRRRGGGPPQRRGACSPTPRSGPST